MGSPSPPSVVAVQATLLRVVVSRARGPFVQATVGTLASIAISSGLLAGAALFTGRLMERIGEDAASPGIAADDLLILSVIPIALAAMLLIADMSAYVARRAQRRIARIVGDTIRDRLVDALHVRRYHRLDPVHPRELAAAITSTPQQIGVVSEQLAAQIGRVPALLLLTGAIFTMAPMVGLALLVAGPLVFLGVRGFGRIYGGHAERYHDSGSAKPLGNLRTSVMQLEQSPYASSPVIEDAGLAERLDDLDRMRIGSDFLRAGSRVGQVLATLVIGPTLGFSIARGDLAPAGLFAVLVLLLRIGAETTALISASSNMLRLQPPIRKALELLGGFADTTVAPSAADTGPRVARLAGGDTIRLEAGTRLLIQTDRQVGRLSLQALVSGVNGSLDRGRLDPTNCDVVGLGASKHAEARPEATTDLFVSARRAHPESSRRSLVFRVSEGRSVEPSDYDLLLRETPEGFEREWRRIDESIDLLGNAAKTSGFDDASEIESADDEQF